MSNVLQEITPLTDKDCLFIAERYKTEFNYPLHQHKAFELNFVEHAAGAQRIVGDCVEEIGEYDLVLICRENLEHVWEQGKCTSKEIHEITIQFPADLFSPDILGKTQFRTIKNMLERASHGLSFPMSAILKVYNTLTGLSRNIGSYAQYLAFMSLMYELSLAEDSKVLASSSFSNTQRPPHENDRIAVTKKYISAHFSEDISLTRLAELACMTPSAFSRYFKLKTGVTLSDYIIDVKLGNAARLLVDSPKTISEICFDCGFNNQSNFNRIFKTKRGLTPREFRAMYKKNRVVV